MDLFLDALAENTSIKELERNYRSAQPKPKGPNPLFASGCYMGYVQWFIQTFI